jgi:hypothetical protein
VAQKVVMYIIPKLKDRRDYRQALIQRREDIDRKIVMVEEQIRKLTAS